MLVSEVAPARLGLGWESVANLSSPHRLLPLYSTFKLAKGNGRDGKGREGKGREGKGRERKGREGKGKEGKGREGKLFCNLTLLYGLDRPTSL